MSGGLDDDWRAQFDAAYREWTAELRAAIRLALASGQPLVVHLELYPQQLGGEQQMLDLIELLGERGAAVGGFWVAEPPQRH